MATRSSDNHESRPEILRLIHQCEHVDRREAHTKKKSANKRDPFAPRALIGRPPDHVTDSFNQSLDTNALALTGVTDHFLRHSLLNLDR